MDSTQAIKDLSEATGQDRAILGGKATVLAELSTAGFAVPPGAVITAAALDNADEDAALQAAAERLGGDRFAVRSSGAAEDLPGASYAGMYETLLNVPAARLADAVRRCFAAATSQRVAAYHGRQGGGSAAMAVLIQPMVDAMAAGVAFTAHPVTGDRSQTLVAAVAGLGDPLVSGEASGEEWLITGREAALTRRNPDGTVLSQEQAHEVAQLARRVAAHYEGSPQDIEWAIDHAGKLWLLQARPMTAVAEPVSWTAPGPGLWMRNFRLGEWLPEAVTPLFATWLLPVLEDGYLDGMHNTVGVRVPFRYALVNGWYYNATPIPSPLLLARVLWEGRTRAVKILFNALYRVGRDPAAADHAVLADLERQWRQVQPPRYQQLTAAAAAVTPQRLTELIDELGRQAGIALWYLAIVGGSAWKMEAALTRFTRRHLAEVLPEGGAQVLLRGLPGAQPVFSPHAVHSADWYHPLAAELPHPSTGSMVSGRYAELAEQRCRTALSGRPRLRAAFDRLLRVNQRYAVIREQQAQQLTFAWPVLRTCANRLGQHLTGLGVIAQPEQVFFCTRDEVAAAVTGSREPVADVVERQGSWQRQRRLAAPLTLGRPPRLIGDVIDRAVQQASGSGTTAEGAIVGHPASAGRVTGPVRIVHGPNDFAAFASGEVLVAKATAPAWTPLFARAAAVVTMAAPWPLGRAQSSHCSPRHASTPSLAATPAMASAATESANAQPGQAFNPRPTSRIAERYVHSSVCVESATTVAERSSFPVRRLAHTSSGITISDTSARPIPTGDGSASPAPGRARTAEKVTQAARAKNDTAISLSASRSRSCGTRERNCQITTKAEDTSTNESSPNPISAVEEAAAPAATATSPSSRL